MEPGTSPDADKLGRLPNGGDPKAPPVVKEPRAPLNVEEFEALSRPALKLDGAGAGLEEG